MRTIIRAGLLAAMLATGATQAQAQQLLFSDDFEYAAGSQLNWNGGANWGVSNGTVDLIGTPNPYGISCAGGSLGCVDLDGSSDDAGFLFKATPILLSSGDYQFTFDHSGNQRGAPADGLNVRIFNVTDGVILLTASFLNASDNFLSETINFSLDSEKEIGFSFFLDNSLPPVPLGQQPVTDNIGPILDNVALTQTTVPLPEPGSLGVLGLGLLGCTALRRRRRL